MMFEWIIFKNYTINLLEDNNSNTSIGNNSDT